MRGLFEIGTHLLHAAAVGPRRPIAAASVLLLMLPGASLHAASITALGDLPGGDFYSWATAVSADGTVVVGYGSSANGVEAFRWTINGGMVGLGDLPGGEFESHATAVSADGFVVVGNSVTANSRRAFRWTSSEGMVDLGALPGGNGSWAADVSADGAVVVGSGSSANGYEAFRWTSSEGMVGLGDLTGGDFSSGASAVSADGSIVVGASNSANGYEAFRWTSSGGMVGLGDLPGGNYGSHGYGISADGSVVVGSSNREAFRWTSDGGMVGLGDPGEGLFSSATAVSADGSVLVVALGSPECECTRYHLWSQEEGTKSLWEILVAKGVSPAASGWEALEPIDISDDGRYVVGVGRHNGDLEAFLVDLQGNVDDQPVIGHLEIPADGSDQAGVGIVSGWHCTASVIEVQFDDLAPITAGSHTTRDDTAAICGDSNNGFSLLWAYSLLGEGQHTAVLYADGVEFARSQFNVTLINGEEFVTGASGAWELPNFPVPGHRLKVKWNEASQNLVIFGSEPMD